MSGEDVIHRLDRIEGKVDSCLDRSARLEEKSDSISDQIVECKAHHHECNKDYRDDLKFRFNLIWTVIGAFFTCLTALTYQVFSITYKVIK